MTRELADIVLKHRLQPPFTVVNICGVASYILDCEDRLCLCLYATGETDESVLENAALLCALMNADVARPCVG